jgi:hypothetical protein
MSDDKEFAGTSPTEFKGQANFRLANTCTWCKSFRSAGISRYENTVVHYCAHQKLTVPFAIPHNAVCDLFEAFDPGKEAEGLTPISYPVTIQVGE